MLGLSLGELTIYGTNFTADAQVEVNGASQGQTFFMNSTEVQLQFSSQFAATSATYEITVVETAGTSNQATFGVYAPNAGPQPFNAIRGFDPGGASSNLMVMADVNGDGRADAVMVGPANDFQPTLSVMLGQSNGQLGAPTVTGNLMTGPMVAGDLDGNGTIDLVCIGQIQNNFEISVLMNDGTGRFTQGQQIAGGGINTVNLNLLDMDGDGKPDLIFNVQGNGQIFFAKNLGGGSFATPVQIGADTEGTSQLAVGDFTGDGKPDVLYTVGDYTTQTASVHLLTNQGGGQFVDSAVPSIPGDVQEFTAGDFNNDGKLDIAVGYLASGVFPTAGVQLYTGNGNGTFTAGSNTVIETNPSYGFVLIAGDFDGDGNLDLAGSDGDTEPGHVAYLWGDGKGNFTPQRVNGPMGFFFCASGDVNGDGIADLIVPDRFGIISVALGNKTRTYPQIQRLTPNVAATTSIADIDGDGLSDIFVGGQPSSVFLNQGDGQFALGGSPAGDGLMVADLDGDGKPEMIGTDGTNILIWKGTGDPSYSGAPITISPSGGAIFIPNSLAIGDFDGDGKPDLLFRGLILFNQGNLQFTQVSLPAAAEEPFLVADFNHDGKLDFVSAETTFLNAGNRTFTAVANNVSFYGAFGLAQGDLNGDGYPDIVVPDGGDAWATVYFGNGDGTFYLEQSIAVGPTNDQSWAVAIADFNGDGHGDIVACLFYSEQCTLYTGDGKGDFLKSNFASATNSISMTVGDLNGDGKPDLVLTNYIVDFRPPNLNVILHQ